MSDTNPITHEQEHSAESYVVRVDDGSLLDLWRPGDLVVVTPDEVPDAEDYFLEIDEDGRSIVTDAPVTSGRHRIGPVTEIRHRPRQNR